MTLSELLDALRSSPSLEALRQIPQPILVEWARGEWVTGERRDWGTPQIESIHFYDDGYNPPRWYAVLGFMPRENRWTYVCRLEAQGLVNLIAHIESRASLLSVLHTRQQQIQQQAPLAAWQAESEARLLEDVG